MWSRRSLETMRWKRKLSYFYIFILSPCDPGPDVQQFGSTPSWGAHHEETTLDSWTVETCYMLPVSIDVCETKVWRELGWALNVGYNIFMQHKILFHSWAALGDPMWLWRTHFCLCALVLESFMAACQLVEELLVERLTLFTTACWHKNVASNKLMNDFAVSSHTAESNVDIALKLNGHLGSQKHTIERKNVKSWI